MKDLIIGSHISFARESETSTDILKPEAGVAYTALGCVEQYDPQVTKDTVKRRCPADGGGKYSTRKNIVMNQEMEMNFSIQEWDEMTLVEILHNAETPTAGAFVPNSRAENVRGWLHIENYDQNDEKILDMFVWCELSIDSYQFGETLDPYALRAEVLKSALNSGTVSNI